VPAAPPHTDEILAVVVVGEGPYDLAPICGVPAVVHAVRTLLGVAGEVAILAPEPMRDEALRLCAGLPLRRPDLGDAGIGSAGIVVLHEAVRPLAPPALAHAVLAAVRAGAHAAVPVLPLTDTVKRVGEDGLLHAAADRATLRVVQSPVAFRPMGRLPAGALDLVARCAAAGTPVHTVPGDPAALPVRTPWDLEVAGLLEAGG
jgi:2-C-methyl-D-erythritol 4-phosphate cytidylyltransferase